MANEVLKARIMQAFNKLGPKKALRAVGVCWHLAEDGGKPYRQNTIRVAIYELVREGKLTHTMTKRGDPNRRWYTLPEKRNESKVSVEVAVEAAQPDNSALPGAEVR